MAGIWPHQRPLRRAARWDGVIPLAEDHLLTPDERRSTVSSIWEQRTNREPFEVAFGTPSLEPNQATELFPAYTEAEVTWWLECSSLNYTLWEVRERIRQGPPHA